MLTIARYKVLQYYDARRRDKVLFSSEALAAISDRLASDTGDEQNEIEILHKCMAKLEKKGRELIILKYTRKISTKELAQKLGAPFQGFMIPYRESTPFWSNVFAGP